MTKLHKKFPVVDLHWSFFNHSREVYKSNDNSYYIYYRVCVDTSKINGSFDEEWEAISNSFNKVHDIACSYGSDLYFVARIYFVPPTIYNDCIEYFEKNAQVYSGLEEIIEGFPKKHNRLIEFSVNKAENKFSPTKDEYVKLRKEVD